MVQGKKVTAKVYDLGLSLNLQPASCISLSRAEITGMRYYTGTEKYFLILLSMKYKKTQ